MESTLALAAADGHRLAAYRTDPPDKPRGGLVVVQEIFGVNSHIRGIADGFAADHAESPKRARERTLAFFRQHLG
jgi:carboxymethylenebutenolidase